LWFDVGIIVVKEEETLFQKFLIGFFNQVYTHGDIQPIFDINENIICYDTNLRLFITYMSGRTRIDINII